MFNLKKRWTNPTTRYDNLIFGSLLITQLIASNFNPILDCDETYNFWEPFHLLLYGHGLQTWEYSPQFALRSYLYLIFCASPGIVLRFLWPTTTTTTTKMQKIFIFKFCRAFFGVCSAYADFKFYENLKNIKNFEKIAKFYAFFKIFGAGQFICGSSFLPSSTASWLLTLAYACFLKNGSKLGCLPIFLVALASLLAWPFVAILGLPFVLDALSSSKRFMRFCLYSFVIGCLICTSMILVDSHFFSKLTLAPWNILKYNVFSGGKGPELYGVEPWHFYLKNLILNWNIMIIFAIFGFIYVLIICKKTNQNHRKNWQIKFLAFSQLTLCIWLLIFLRQPHKEERFMFPIYSLLCLAGSLGFIGSFKFISKFFNKKIGYIFEKICMAIFIVFGVSRMLALVVNYGAPARVYQHLFHVENQSVISNVCIGKEWYRFHSSFYVPENFRVQFIESEFRGILPSHFENDYSFEKYDALKNVWLGYVTGKLPKKSMNDLNQQERDRFVDLYRDCEYFIDLDDGTTSNDSLEPNFSRKFKILFSEKFLLQQKSSTFFRAFYFPVLSEMYSTYGSYNVLKVF